MVTIKATVKGKKDNKLRFRGLAKMLAVMIVVSLIFIGLGVGGVVVFHNNPTNLVLSVILVVFGVIYTPIVLLVLYIIQRKKNSLAVNTDDVEETYVFDEEKVIITRRKGQEVTTSQMEYMYLHKVVETPDEFLIYLSPSRCCIAPKSGITEGTPEALTAQLTKALNYKFYIQK